MSRIGGVEELEKFDELAAAVAVLDEGRTWPVNRSMPASKLTSTNAMAPLRAIRFAFSRSIL
jgi:hypothetical protein